MRLMPLSYSVTFVVEPKGVRSEVLEFVLHDAEERNEKEHGFYSDALWQMMGDALKNARPNNPDWAQIADKMGYGSEQFTLACDHPEDIGPALEVCGAAAGRWANKYRVSEMKAK